MKISAGIIFVWENKILLCHPTNSSSYKSFSFPKGGVNKGETLIDAAIRECKEETGIIANENNISKNFIVNYNKMNCKKIFKKVHLFLIYINSLSELGLTSLEVPKNQMQLSENDWAGFLTLKECKERAFWRFLPLIESILQ